MAHDVLILGASCRAAAFSSLRAGLRPRCADYFADRDLAAVCPVVQISPVNTGREFLAVAESLPPSPWFYTGGFENHPEWVEQIARRHRLWGASARSIRIVRDPMRVAALMHDEGIPVPAVSHDPQSLPRDGSWLVKPLRSGGGRDIRPLRDDHVFSSARCYFQERIAGPSFSALFIGQTNGTRLLGVTQQVLGLAGNPFAYRGSIGPWPIDDSLAFKLQKIGEVIASASGLLGWFGIDYILCDGEPWPVEVNPRYTASLEVHELATGEAFLGEHRRVFEDSAVLLPERPGNLHPRAVAKLVIHAPFDWTAPDLTFDGVSRTDLFAMTPIADIPWPGTRFASGDPVMTLFASGENVTECESRLTVQVREWMERIWFTYDDNST